MNKNNFSLKITLFHGRKTPEEALLVGYGALIEVFQLTMPIPKKLALISFKKRQYKTEDWQVFTPRHQPEETLYKQLVFCLKYEGVNLLFFKKLFDQLNENSIIELLSEEPTGQYTKKIWFLYEWLLQKKLPIPDLKTGNYTTVLEEQLQFGISNGSRSIRHRIINNLPGTINFCPIISKTPKLEHYINQNLASQKAQLFNGLRSDILQRASAFLLLKDSKASFTIEGESPKSKRAARWGQAIGQAGMRPLNQQELERLQQIVIENPRFLKLGYRDQGGFIGDRDRDTFSPLPDHISAKQNNLETLMNGWLATNKLLQEDTYDAVLAASSLAFGFVFIHPFVDGNGRIHRYLMHHILAEKKFAQQGVIFPVSTSILNHINDYRKVLENYSLPLLDFIEWKETTNHNVEVTNETLDFYRFFDATAQAEFLYDCVQDTIENIIPQEVNYLLKYDEFKTYLENYFEMPDDTIALLVRFLEQGNGTLSKRAIEKEFSVLQTEEIQNIEESYQSIFTN